jgi:peptidoglycan/LPS O-acetylase OafA/YrhL
MEQKGYPRILELDGLRAFSVAFVVLYHMSQFSGGLPRGYDWVDSVIKQSGEGAVHVFFVISGFIITTLLCREMNSTGNICLRSFYIRRFFRIVPPLALYLVTLIVLAKLDFIEVSNHNVLCGGLFLTDMQCLDSRPFLVGHTWSLSVEEQFYIVFPFLLIAQKVRSKISAILLICYSLFLMSLKIEHEVLHHIGPHWVDIGALFNFRYIAVGAFAAVHGHHIVALVANKPRWMSTALMIFILFLNVLPITSNVYAFYLRATFEPMLVVLFVMWFVHNPNLCTTLRWWPVQRLGAYSYSAYLWQQLFTAPPDYYRGWHLAQSPLAVLPILALAAASYHLIEKPSSRLARAINLGFGAKSASLSERA